jgi:hypothetical protein
MQLNFRASMLLVILLAPLLVSCSSGPSESEARESWLRLKGERDSSFYRDFKLIGCDASNDRPGYRCVIYFTNGGFERFFNVNYVKIDGKWSAFDPEVMFGPSKK